MTRRFFLFALPLVASEPPKTPRNELAWAHNDFSKQDKLWADRMNAKVETVDAKAVELFQSLPELWRQVEKRFKTWVRGY